MDFKEEALQQIKIAGTLCLAPSTIFEGLSNSYSNTAKLTGTNRLAVTLGLGFAWLWMVAATVIIPIVYLGITLPLVALKHTSMYVYEKISTYLPKIFKAICELFSGAESKAANTHSQPKQSNTEIIYTASEPRPKEPVIYRASYHNKDVVSFDEVPSGDTEVATRERRSSSVYTV